MKEFLVKAYRLVFNLLSIEGISSEIETNKIPKAIKYALNEKSGWPIGVILPPSDNSKQNLTEVGDCVDSKISIILHIYF